MRLLGILGTFAGLVLGIMVARGQESLTVLQTGTAAITEQDPVESSGFRMGLAWEFMPSEERWAMGASLGLVQITGVRSSLGGKRNFRLSALPICAVSRIMFGSEKLNVFVRVGLGAHYTTITFESPPLATKTSGWGMAANTSGGIMYWITGKIFVAGDYEWLWLGNTHPNLGSVGSFSLSAGLKL
jgi:hypothetical protein